MNIISYKQGFISLFTVLLATVILAITIGMSSVALKQIVLTSTVDDANEAFYAADSALQCAIMLDVQGIFQVGGPDEVYCGSIGPISIDDSDSGIFIFNQQTNGFEWANSNCTRVRVEKDAAVTQIEALGYNVTCDQVGQSPRTVERALRVRYGN
jgi:hypothetical protein